MKHYSTYSNESFDKSTVTLVRRDFGGNDGIGEVVGLFIHHVILEGKIHHVHVLIEKAVV